MEKAALKKLKLKIAIIFPLSLIIIGGILMISAGTWRYWPAWIFCVSILIPMTFITHYFFKKSPEFLERRLKFKEKEVAQKKIILIGDIVFFIAFLIPGLDFRFGWSNVPTWLVITSNLIVLGSYTFVFLAFKENPYAARTVEVFEDHKLIETGPYAIVRHPMYAGIIPMFTFMPLALGSFWAMIPIIGICAILVARTLNEEKVLRRDLPGYAAYCKKVRYRLLPRVW